MKKIILLFTGLLIGIVLSGQTSITEITSGMTGATLRSALNGNFVTLRDSIDLKLRLNGFYPNAGIVLSTGSGWGTSITNNSANWNTAYGWGNHASAGYLTSLGTALIDADFSSNGIMRRTAAGVYSTLTDNSSNWNTAYGWGNHASGGYLTSVDISDLNTTGTASSSTYLRGDGAWTAVSSGGGMVYPAAGIAISTGSAWTTSIASNRIPVFGSAITGTASSSTYLRGDGSWQTVTSGSSTITDLGGTAWRVFYSNGSGDVTELALGADGTYLRSNGASAAPTFSTPSGTGDMLASVYDRNGNDVVDEAETAATVTGFSRGSGSLALVGDDGITLNTTATTSVTLPTSGTLATTSNINDSLNARIGDGIILSDVAVLKSDSTGGPGHYASWHDMNTGLNGKEDALGNPGVNGYVLSSTTEGVRTWIENGSGGSMVYPSGSGIPIVSSGASWGTTITDNSTNWNSAYSWGNHASAGYEPGLGNPASDGYVLTSTAAGVRSWAASSGTVTIEDVSGVVGDSLDAIRAASVQGLTLGDSSLYVTQTALNTAIAGVETGAVDSSLYVTVTRLTDSLNVIRTQISSLISTINSAGLLVTSINVASLSKAVIIDTDGGSLDFEADVSPNTALDTTLTWSYIAGTGTADFETEVGAPTLTALTDGTVTVRATANDGSGIYGEVQITISNQVGPIAMSTAELGTYNDSIILTIWDRNLHQDSIPPTSAFALTEDGNNFGIEAITINEDSLFIALDSTGAYGSTYLLSYTPGTPAVQDSSENNAVAFSGMSVTNNIGAVAEAPSLLNTNTYAWLIADAANITTYSSTTGINTWADVSGNGNDFVTTHASGQGSRVWDAANEEVHVVDTTLEARLGIATIDPALSVATIYMVVRLNSHVANSTILLLSTDGARILQHDVSPDLTLYMGNWEIFNSNIGSGYGILTAVINTTNSSLQWNDLTAATGNAGSRAINEISIGDFIGSTLCSIKEIIIRDVVDSAQDIIDVKTYLNTKYSLGL